MIEKGTAWAMEELLPLVYEEPSLTAAWKISPIILSQSILASCLKCFEKDCINKGQFAPIVCISKILMYIMLFGGLRSRVVQTIKVICIL